MREYMGIFRGKRIDNGEWVEGTPIFAWGCCKMITAMAVHPEFVDVGNVYYAEGHPVDPDTVGEYTGLRDKNGKLIFEGDKLIPFDNDIDKMVVEFHDGTFTLCLYGDRGYRSESGDWEYDGSNYGVIECEPLTSYGDEIVVCGNIHDNPELKGGEGDG